MPSLNLNGRLQRMEKQVAPTINEISKVIDRVIYDTPVWFAFVASHREDNSPEDDNLILEFWQHESWHGAKLALDARWPRALWEPIFWDDTYKLGGYKDYLDYIAAELWFMDAEPKSAAQNVIDNKFDAAKEKHNRYVYGRFCTLSNDEQASWREIARADQAVQYENGGHSPDVQTIFDRFVTEYNKLLKVQESDA